jgi:hypothetical protein
MPEKMGFGTLSITAIAIGERVEALFWESWKDQLKLPDRSVTGLLPTSEGQGGSHALHPLAVVWAIPGAREKPK